MTEHGGNQHLPHWDLSTLYSSLDSPGFEGDFARWSTMIVDLRTYFDEAGIGICTNVDASATPDRLETAVGRFNEIMALGHKLYSYVTGFAATDSRNVTAQSWMSRLQIQMAEVEKLEPRFAAWVGTLGLDALASQSTIVADHAYPLLRIQIEAKHLMQPAEEELAADLNLTGGRAWSRLYSTFSSQIVAPVEVGGASQLLPMTAIRNLAYDGDRATRQRAYEAELHAWQRNAVPIAAALNSIKGQANTLGRRRGWDTPLDLALFNNAINRSTLETMMDTAKQHFPDFRRYLKAKAKLLGVERCAWYDLFAPVGSHQRSWSFDNAHEFIVERFGEFSPSLGNLAARAFGGRWIDAEPRDGKRGGAFCMWAQGDESRILTNFQESYGGMSTLAHELGHAYHNWCLAGRTSLQRQTPMTLAETASTFCQVIVRNAALEGATAEEQLAIIEADLQDNTQVIVDISSRFLFESEVFARRQGRELSSDELCSIMTESQLATYGDGLDSSALHPYMWAVKPHYYSSVFYNFPYMFGLLFALGVYARYREAPAGFVSKYEALLSSTGMNDALTLAVGFGIDLAQPDFWEASLALVVGDINRFEQLVAEKTAALSQR